jgi:hypothetical protein
MEGHCSTGQRSHRAVVPVEEEEEEDFKTAYAKRLHLLTSY